MANFKFIPLLALMCLVSSCGANDIPSGSPSDESQSDYPVSEPESESEPESQSEPESESEKEEKDFGLSLKMPAGRPLKIAQFADIHFGVEGRDWHNDKVDRTKTFMDYIVETQQPDLIVCSGDNILSTGTVKLKQFIDQMEEYETPWTFIYGNHDAEYIQPNNSKEALHNILLSYNTEYLLYEDGYTEPAANRYGNFSIQLTDSTGEKLVGSIILLDSGLHDGTGYEALTTGQIDWYKNKIDELQTVYAAQSDNTHEVIPSLVFAHINLQEHAELYERATKNDGASFVIEQDLGAGAKQSILDGGPKENTGMYQAMVEKGSTKAYFVGHAHTYKFQVKDNEDGIVLGFAPQTGFSKCFEDNDLGRSSYVYNLSDDFSFTTTDVKEDCSKIGLLYSGTYEGKMTVNPDTGLYTVQLEFALWNRILFSYRGQRIKVSDFTSITGYFKNSDQATWTDDLYSSTGANFIYSGSKGNVYIFEIDLEAMTLNIDIWVDPTIPEKPITEVDVKNVDADSGADAVSVWTQAGYKLRTFDQNTGKGVYVGNGWRYYIFVDAEGKIAYAVVNPPNGYGGPMGTGYYCHSDYSDYLTNPCFNILDGYGPWTEENPTPSNKYELVIPEGWMCITAHGSANAALVTAFSNGQIKDSSDANINRRGVYLDSLRVTFDSENMLIKASWVE